MAKKFYESYIIIDGNLDDAAIEEVIKKYESFLLKNESEIINIDKIGRRRLAYPIQKSSNGFYVCFEINSSSDSIPKIERTYILDDSILRYLTIYVSPRTRKEKEEHFKNRAIIQAKYEESKAKTDIEAAGEVENKDTVKDPKKVVEEIVSSN